MRRFSFLLGAGVAAAAAPAVVHLAVGFHRVSFTGRRTSTRSASAPSPPCRSGRLDRHRRAAGRHADDGRRNRVRRHGGPARAPRLLDARRVVRQQRRGRDHRWRDPARRRDRARVLGAAAAARLAERACRSCSSKPRCSPIVLALGVSALIWPSLLPRCRHRWARRAGTARRRDACVRARDASRRAHFLLTRRVLDLAVAVGSSGSRPRSCPR